MTNEMTRKDFLQTIAGLAAAAAAPTLTSCSAAPKANIKRGVSFYSYQEEFFTGTMSVEDCIRESADMGAFGIELLGEAMIPNYPNPPSQWIDQWNGWMEKYKTVPANYCQFLETKLHSKPPFMTAEEGQENMVRDIDLAKRMGFKIVRPNPDMTSPTMMEAIERCLPNAEKNDITLAVHVFSMLEPWMALIEKTKTKHMGFVPDMSIFTERPLRIARERKIRDGLLTPEIADFIEKAWASGMPEEKAMAEARAMGYKEEERGYGTYLTREVYGINRFKNDIKALEEHMQYVPHFHGKFYEMTDDCQETTINYEKGIAMLKKGGFNGYIVSEYEGQRFTQDAFETDSCAQVRRHQIMLRRLLGEI